MIELNDNYDEFKDGKIVCVGQGGSLKCVESRVIFQAAQCPMTTQRLQEVARKIMKQMIFAPQPPMRIDPLRPQLSNPNMQPFPSQ